MCKRSVAGNVWCPLPSCVIPKCLEWEHLEFRCFRPGIKPAGSGRMLTSCQSLYRKGELQLVPFLFSTPRLSQLFSLRCNRSGNGSLWRAWMDGCFFKFYVSHFPPVRGHVLLQSENDKWEKKEIKILVLAPEILCAYPLGTTLISFHFCFCLNKHTNENKYFWANPELSYKTTVNSNCVGGMSYIIILIITT